MSRFGKRTPWSRKDREPHEEQGPSIVRDGEREDDESSTRAVLDDAANPYHRAGDRWSRIPMIIALVLIGLVVLFALIEFIPGLGG
ncbi:hypothetical protein LFT44_21805 (plasmid) [Arthrobacter sp. FW306-05-C]|uniref:Uncharacterized protein n=1 Tax=Pseudarthrobacter enclensis TaxID=993070 RepID=A0ABT9RTM9_9MICC|nr:MULTISPECIES: hypothetical protein [Micrococcaceae]MDP9888603.1 hypothetical protein [Pseudarthrobacter enclensis]UKA69167.1 hypothetical protein LFT44_21805 [Arthrobacter sp. FW306-05-C]